MSSVKDKDDIKVAVVESVNDPTCSGRIKIRIPGITDDFEDGKLPWVSPPPSPIYSGHGGGMLSIPRVGQTIRVRYKEGDINSCEWVGTMNIDPDLMKELNGDYEGSHTLLYDSDAGISVRFQKGTGLVLYYKGSKVQISPDNTISIHYGGDNSGVNIQLLNGQIRMTAPDSLDFESGKTNELKGRQVKITGSECVQIKGNTPGECAVNGRALINALNTLARAIDAKAPNSSSATEYMIKSMTQALLNDKIQYV